MNTRLFLDSEYVRMREDSVKRKNERIAAPCRLSDRWASMNTERHTNFSAPFPGRIQPSGMVKTVGRAIQARDLPLL